MARFTVKSFAQALGLKDSRESFTNAGIILKTFSQKGLATVVGKVKPQNGRPPLVYQLDQDVAAAIGVKPNKPSRPTQYDIWEVLEMTNKIRSSMGLDSMSYDHFTRRLRELRDGHKGGNNPYQASFRGGRNGCTRVFDDRSARFISRNIAPMTVSAHDWREQMLGAV